MDAFLFPVSIKCFSDIKRNHSVQGFQAQNLKKLQEK